PAPAGARHGPARRLDAAEPHRARPAGDEGQLHRCGRKRLGVLMGSGLMRAIILAIALAGCAATSAPPAPHNYLAGTSWRRVDDENASPHNPTIAFEEARASGYSGCNRWFASIAHDGEVLTFGDLGSTRMACAEPAMAAEQN